ncbi:hypothetical protein H6F32_02215 [Anabaena sp. FACHB-1237]|uniref:hypothetical protein n=1 Tax=Anabaena sp. FACHB-1237 TaxID=2692769 RepID=UPI00168191A9|nr:hypothetical protein [Anabaena sp. FACHB-1237]MBD2136422.1 hypothetical protein [Anabaena sp. FACHB-1237]
MNHLASEDTNISKTELILYLIPVMGVVPSLWSLYHHQGDKEKLRVSRLSVTLTFSWIVTYLLLGTGAATSDFLALRLLILNSFLTSAYFLVSLWLIWRVFQGKVARLSGFSGLATRIFPK